MSSSLEWTLHATLASSMVSQSKDSTRYSRLNPAPRANDAYRCMSRRRSSFARNAYVTSDGSASARLILFSTAVGRRNRWDLTLTSHGRIAIGWACVGYDSVSVRALSGQQQLSLQSDVVLDRSNAPLRQRIKIFAFQSESCRNGSPDR